MRGDMHESFLGVPDQFILIGALLLAGSGLVLGCAHGTAPPASLRREVPETEPWVSALDREQPLVGKIWRTSAGAWVDTSFLLDRVGQADFVLLGEQHDNPDHHRLEAYVIASMVRGGKRPIVALEMLDPDQEGIVVQYRSTPGSTARGLGAALAWDKSGWPAWSLYLPIAEVAMDAGLPMVSANLPRAMVRTIAHRGLDGIPPEVVSSLGLDRPLAPPLEASLEQEMRSSHCGQLPEAMVVPMALAQRARDGQMAARMLAAAKGGSPVVLVAGAGHVRIDRGVAARLREVKPDARVFSTAFVEVEGALATPEAYAPRFQAARLPFDFVWFTPRARDEDPCAGFQLRRP
jgi:uncharacterized iron-regulated protein